MPKLTLNTETLRRIADDSASEVAGGYITQYCSVNCPPQSNRQGCFTHFADCSTNRNWLC